MLRLSLLMCLVLSMVSCRSKYEPQTVQVVDPGPPLRVLPTIRVLDAGMTPRALLRYRVPPGQTETLYVELARQQTTQAGGQSSQSGLPPLQLQVVMGPASGTPQGFIHHPVKITKLRLSKDVERMNPAQRENLEKSLAPLLQVEGWSDMDVQGRIRRSEFKGADQVPPDLNVMLGNIRSALLSVPFPDEPLGARARWEVERKIQFTGIWIDQVVTYRIERMRRDELDLQITARGSAEPQQTSSGRVEAYQSSVIGSATVRLTNFTPHSEAEATTQMRLSRPTQTGERELIRIEAKTAVQLYPEEKAESFDSDEKEKPADPDDAKVITDPSQQKLKWYSP